MNDEQFHEHMTELVQEGLGEVQVNENGPLPVEAKDLAREARDAVADIASVEELLTERLGELHSQRDLIPADGLARLTGEAKKDAETRIRDANRRFDKSVQALDAALVDAAQPTLKGSDRELLGRDTLRTAVGDATSSDFKSRVLGFATSTTDPDALAILTTPFFRSLAISRQVHGVERFTASVKKVVAGRAIEVGEEGQVAAQQARETLGGFAKARSAAMARVNRRFQ